MNNTQTEGKVTYLIPDEKREEYFNYVDILKSKVKNVTDDNWNVYSDPMVTIDFSEFSRLQCCSIIMFMKRIGAKEIDVLYG